MASLITAMRCDAFQPSHSLTLSVCLSSNFEAREAMEVTEREREKVARRKSLVDDEIQTFQSAWLLRWIQKNIFCHGMKFSNLSLPSLAMSMSVLSLFLSVATTRYELGAVAPSSDVILGISFHSSSVTLRLCQSAGADGFCFCFCFSPL